MCKGTNVSMAVATLEETKEVSDNKQSAGCLPTLVSAARSQQLLLLLKMNALLIGTDTALPYTLKPFCRRAHCQFLRGCACLRMTLQEI